MSGYIGNTPATAITNEKLEDRSGSLTTGGSANAYTLTTNQVYTAYEAGLSIRTKVNHSNTGAATINIDGLGAKSIKKVTVDGILDVSTGDLQIGGIYDFVYDVGNDYFILVGQRQDTNSLLSDTSARVTTNIGFKPHTILLDSSEMTADFNNSLIQTVLVDRNITSILFQNADSGDCLEIWAKNDSDSGSGSFTMSGWPANTTWTAGTTPTLTATAGATDIFVIRYDKKNDEFFAAAQQNHP